MALKKITKPVIFTVILLCALKAPSFFNDRENINFENSPKAVTLNDNGLTFEIVTNTDSVDSFLREKELTLGERDRIIPPPETRIFPGANIEIKRAARIKIEVDGKKIENYTLEKNVAGALSDSGVTLNRLDKTEPVTSYPASNDMKIIVTRINVEEIIAREPIDFKTTVKNDPKLGWREKKVTTTGEKGIREVKYRVTYKNGKEISRIVLQKNITKDPVTQVETQGTYVKTGKAAKGQGTWYAYQGGMYAASLSIARGGYAKVTNTANGKSVIVQINDSGPYGKGRIIDLDKPAFQKIADLGAGVIGVKVEEVLN